MNRLLSSLLATLAVISLGCSTLSPRPDLSRFFTLSPLPQVEGAARSPSGAEGIVIGVGPVKLPGYLDRQELVLRSSQNRFTVAANDLWAESLEDNFTRVVSQNLATLLQTDRVFSYPWPDSRRPSYQITIEVLRFEANAAQQAQLWARWALVDGNSRKPLSVQLTHRTRPIQDRTSEAAVAALSDALGDFSRELADAIGTAANLSK